MTGLDGLTAAVDAAARAAHNLDELIGRLARADLVEQLRRVLESGGDRNLDLHACNVVGRFLDRVGAADFVVIDGLEILACQLVRYGTESRFHNAAGRAEDGARAGTDRHDGIELLVGKSGELDAGGLDHLRKLTGGDGDVVVLHVVAALVGTLDLEFLRYAGHYGYDHDISGVDARLLGVVGLNHCALHLLG